MEGLVKLQPSKHNLRFILQRSHFANRLTFWVIYRKINYDSQNGQNQDQQQQSF